MKKKDLAEEYAIKEYECANGDSDLIFEDNRCFTFDDIKAAFNAGSESVIESASKLEWKEIGFYEDCGIYLEVCKADKPLDNFLIRKWSPSKKIELLSNGLGKGCFNSIEEAKSYAVKVYEERIKKVLGL
jgi:hypothetical protein